MQRQNTLLYQCMLVAGIIFLLDQFSKFIVGFSRFFGSIVINTGVSFGLLRSNHLLISTLLLLVLGILVVCVIQKNWRQHPIATGLFIGGALSNIVDRVQYGGVRDWLPVGIFSIKNNLADWAICIAAVWVVTAPLRKVAKTTKPSQSIK